VIGAQSNGAKAGTAIFSCRRRCARFESWRSSGENLRRSASRRGFPGFVEPTLAASIERVPQGERWIHEVKFDGYRVQLHIGNENVRVFARRGNDWTTRFRKFANDAFLISASSAIIDDEVVLPAADGKTDFSVLQDEFKGKSTSWRRCRGGVPSR
jgi:ATP-dependent DNA ligase